MNEYDEVKTGISISVAEAMEADEIPQSVTEFFKAVSDMLSRRQERLVSKEVN